MFGDDSLMGWDLICEFISNFWLTAQSFLKIIDF
jgi:hypothetical protein